MKKLDRLNNLILDNSSQNIHDKFYDDLSYMDNLIYGKEEEDLLEMAKENKTLNSLELEFSKLKLQKKKKIESQDKLKKYGENLRQNIQFVSKNVVAINNELQKLKEEGRKYVAENAGEDQIEIDDFDDDDVDEIDSQEDDIFEIEEELDLIEDEINDREIVKREHK